jgi:hypothetical protein
MAEKYRSSSMQSFDPNNLGKERYWTANSITSEQIDAYLSEGHTLLKIHRIGSGTDTRYNIMPV